MRPKDGGCFETTAKERAETEAAPVIIGHILSTTSECDPLGENDQPDCARIDPGYREIRRLRDIAKVITLPEPESDLEYIVGEKIGQIEKTSPAYELLDVLCKSGPGALSVCRDREAFLNRTIVLDWGQLVSRRDSPMKRWLGGKCSPRQYLGGTGDPISKMWLTLRIFIEAFPYLRPDDAGQCPFHDTMVANDVIDAANLGDSKSEGGWTGNEILRSMFKDRVVLYGLQIAGVGDYVRSPTLGRVAGTYAHAMALDNLITRGPSTWVSPDPLVSKGHWTWALVIETLLAIALILAGWRVEERNDREFARVVLEQGRRDADAKAAYELHRVFKWTFLFAAALAVAAVVLAEQHIFNWPPGDWIALLAVAIVGKPNHRKYEEWMGGRTRPG